MLTQNLGYPRIGSKRQLKKACEAYWAGKIPLNDLQKAAAEIRETNWKLQQQAGLDLIPSNDFSFYDQVLDMAFTVGAIPGRYHEILTELKKPELDLYFAMARGYQKDGLDIIAMEMTKWFDTNYHYIVPEFTKDQQFKLFSTKVLDEFKEAKRLGIHTKPVLLGPVSFLLLGKEKEAGFHRIDLLKALLPVYIDLLKKLESLHADWVQLDEPFLVMDLKDEEKAAVRWAYQEIKKAVPGIKTLLTTYFGALDDNLTLAAGLPICGLHVDLVRNPEQLEAVLEKVPANMSLSLGLVDGRNIWKNDYQASLELINKARAAKQDERLLIGPSCSLLHSPCDLEEESNEHTLSAELKDWLAFARQKTTEITALKVIVEDAGSAKSKALLEENQASIAKKRTSERIHKPAVRKAVEGLTPNHSQRKSAFASRKTIQAEKLYLPDFPTTTIGSFPQTKEVRQWRSQLKKEVLTENQYVDNIKAATQEAIRWQEEVGLDVLVHGEFERNDMVEYFGEKLEGFAFTQYGWVQSYGSRCVKPPIIYGDVSRPKPMTLFWTTFAQSLTDKPVKGMLTGPVTILQWSFVRNDQSRKATCQQIALAIREEVKDLEKSGIQIIQIDEPALREGLPLRHAEWNDYLQWAVECFRISASAVEDSTQIHTHMCYSEFNDIIEHIAAMDADVITIECSRSQMELLDAFAQFNYPNDIGPGVYDIHSPRVPASEEMVTLMQKAQAVVPYRQLWVNPDCGLKTRGWEETKEALGRMVEAARKLRAAITSNVTVS
ncbi:5-methyltetrahydropteroyltriglutamate--homocysteine S-methyltransferase [Echinicola vietnamensis]|uniref:5-methyltetrahydropteroyltriglutamate--homocysteine methyltransferase n=1 Tax=Echinicola vietnamensis (strain DSM 17526 / LMG 23754 / KMM 6221) TaxID=926556 RepID=L0G1B3_ECHVK|nr:5-methyltetrahydropteroyltriglutamate--homocysteine S-methyltransferase [Echinicola vietnamensis]AGA78801.1 5-methyltetrahydropteroyltriglutamate--homocysteine S-methyltransferase [Echinicola vietnamensis DSM 17526]